MILRGGCDLVKSASCMAVNEQSLWIPPPIFVAVESPARHLLGIVNCLCPCFASHDRYLVGWRVKPYLITGLSLQCTLRSRSASASSDV